ncbi:MAG: hypothetical protein ABIQ11_11515 [Saprospiraceae bacterium]
MTTKQLRQEIVKALEQVPDEVLADLLEYLNELKSKSEDQVVKIKHFRRILEEDKNLLRRLAQ